MLDPNVVISGVLSSRGAPADVLRALAAGEFELLVSQALLDESSARLPIPSCGDTSMRPQPANWFAGSPTVRPAWLTPPLTRRCARAIPMMTI